MDPFTKFTRVKKSRYAMMSAPPAWFMDPNINVAEDEKRRIFKQVIEEVDVAIRNYLSMLCIGLVFVAIVVMRYSPLASFVIFGGIALLILISLLCRKRIYDIRLRRKYSGYMGN